MCVRAFAHLCFMACISLRTSCTCVLWHLRLCERGAPSTWYVGGRPRSADTKFPFLSQQREWNRGKSVSKAGRGWVGKRPSPSCPSWLRFPAKVRCPRHSPRGRGRDAWPWDGRLRGRTLDHVQPPGTWSQGPALAAPEQGGGVVLELGSVPTATFLPPPESPGRPPPSTSGLSWWA